MAESKDAMLHIRVKPSQLKKIKEIAEIQGLSQSQFCLNAILSAIGEDLESPVTEGILARLQMVESQLEELRGKVA